MQVTIIGTGNVATVLGKLIFANNHSINQIYGRNIDAASLLANQLNAQPINKISDLNNESDLYIIAVSDKSIATICSKLNVTEKIVVHTAGSVNNDILKNVSRNFGVLYPIQSLRKEMDIATATIPFLINGNNKSTQISIENFAKTLSKKVAVGNDEVRLQLHTAAVFSCNFVNYMYLQSANFCEANNLDFTLLQPLIEETALRLRTHHPKDVFTGPAVRKDVQTIEKHITQLNSNKPAQELYTIITKMIMNNY